MTFCIYLFMIFSLGNICPGKIKNVLFCGMEIMVYLLCLYFHIEFLYFILAFFFLIFYSDLLVYEKISRFCMVSLIFLITILFSSPFIWIGSIYLNYCLMSYYKGYLRWFNFILPLIVYGLLVYQPNSFHVFLGFVLFFLLTINLEYYDSGFKKTKKALQEEMMQNQFQDLKDMYMNIRGWRHDYHNHIQVLKTDLEQGHIKEARKYLNSIEHELNQVDTFVKSGNMMTDAILNSKLSIATQKQIHIDCEAYLPENLSIEDADLCTILANALDNAIESCEKVEYPYIHIYMVLKKDQLYISIQNAATSKLILDSEKFITHKRGNHGLGLKRVKGVVNKYDGYMRVGQESGIFSLEISIPCNI